MNNIPNTTNLNVRVDSTLKKESDILFKKLGLKCHIEPDWLLIYKYIDEQLILLLIATGNHSELF